MIEAEVKIRQATAAKEAHVGSKGSWTGISLFEEPLSVHLLTITIVMLHHIFGPQAERII